VHEKIWYRSPGFVRIERDTQTIVRRPDVEWVSNADAAPFLRRNVPPSLDLVPEPLSPALAFYGTVAGPGPTIAGRATQRIEFVTNTERRIAYVDAERFAELGAKKAFVLGKERLGKGAQIQTRKTTLAVRYNIAIPDSMFEIPRTDSVSDAGFHTARVRSLALPPHAEPRTFRRIAAGTSRLGDAILYLRGALPILVETTAATRGLGVIVRDDERSEPVAVDGRPATLVVGIYSSPRVVFDVLGRRVTIWAPLPRDALLALAAEMYPS
jgi:hypothetical protein